MILLPVPVLAFLSSTKLPMWLSSPSFVPGRRRAKGPMRPCAPTSALSITDMACTWVPSASVQSFSTQLGPIFTPLPSRTVPSKTQPTSMDTSRPHSSVPRMSMRSGSASMTPLSVRRSARLRWWRRSRKASWVLLLTPSVSHSASGCAVTTPVPSATAAAITSVR